MVTPAPGAGSAWTGPTKRARLLCRRLSALMAVGIFLAATVPAEPATTGIAYDTLAIRGVSIDPAIYTQDAFETDFRAALAQIAAPAPSPTAMQPSYTLASRSYITASKQRTDLLASNTALIIDCDARTVSILDLPAKKYYLRSFDAPFPEFPEPGGGGIQPMVRSESSTNKYSLTVQTRALGVRRIDGVDADGFETVSSTSPSGLNGSVSTTTTYYSTFTSPASRCPGFQPAYDGFQFYLWRWGALFGRFDAKYPDSANPNIRTSGVRLPNRLPLLSVSGTRGLPVESSITSVSEIANIRRISSSDPIFTIPADFTPAGRADRAVVMSQVRRPETSGLAYDQVTKSGTFVASQSFVEPQRLTAAAFKADFERAVRPALRIDRIETVMRLYRTPTKSRTDDVKWNFAWIVDCDANTATRLNLAKKTFHVDAALIAIGATPPPGPPMPAIDVSASLESRVLGIRRIGDVDARGYETITTISMGIQGSSPSSTEFVVTSYYSDAAVPALTCRDRLTELASFYVPNLEGGAGNFLARMLPKPNVTTIGVPLPERVPLISVSRVTRGLPGMQGGSPVGVSEAGHFRAISSDDTIFSVTPDFKPG